MLCVNNYTQEYIDECRTKIAIHVSAYQALVSAAKKHSVKPPLDKEIKAFEPYFFNNLVLVLDGHFTHRARALELKDGNPLNEVRMLCNSMIQNNSMMIADKTIKYDPAKSVLKYQIGDTIQLNVQDFTSLSAAFLAEIEMKYI